LRKKHEDPLHKLSFQAQSGLRIEPQERLEMLLRALGFSQAQSKLG
jgi:hypothetical protein